MIKWFKRRWYEIFHLPKWIRRFESLPLDEQQAIIEELVRRKK
jgi:hypothetical protein